MWVSYSSTEQTSQYSQHRMFPFELAVLTCVLLWALLEVLVELVFCLLNSKHISKVYNILTVLCVYRYGADENADRNAMHIIVFSNQRLLC